MKSKKNPWYWIPLLNFASGFPYAIIISVSVLMYKNLGISNEDIGMYTSLLYLPWVIKPLWSPFIDLHATKRKWFLSMQLVISIAFLIVGLTIPMQHFFVLSLALFWVGAFASASNDVAIDGFYLLALPKDKQSFFLRHSKYFLPFINAYCQWCDCTFGWILRRKIRRQKQSLVIHHACGSFDYDFHHSL